MNRGALISLVLCVMLGGFSVQASAKSGDDKMRQWQLGLLLNPGVHQLDVERRGRVVIYDGLHSADIDRALEEQFERIDSMMFTGTVVTDARGVPIKDPETGEVMVEDDGCD